MSRLDGILSRLNPEQHRAAMSPSSTILVIAGAGSGKTSVLASRIGHLQVNERVGTSNMLSLTFSRLAAREMKERVGKLIGDPLARKLTAGTFHSFCVRVLREHGHHANLESTFGVYGEEDRKALLESVISDLRYTSKVRTSQVDPWTEYTVGDPNVKAVIDEYRYRLRQNNAVDLDGLLAETVGVLEEYPDVASDLRERYTHVLVDEYQDTDDRQERIIQAIRPDNLFVVGDPSQAIYGWRGARIENILTFEERHPECDVIRLERNYRSTKPILDVANRAIAEAAHTSPLKLRTDKEGESPRLGTHVSDSYEAQNVASDIKVIGEPWREVAVLCRTNAQVALVQTALEQGGTPAFVVSNKHDPLNAYDVRRVIDYMSYLCNRQDGRAFRRILNWPRRRLSDLEIAKIEQRVLASNEDEATEVLDAAAGLTDDLKPILGSGIWTCAGEMFGRLTECLGLRGMYETQGLTNRIEELDVAEKAITRWEERQREMGEDDAPYAFLYWLRTRDIQARLEQEEADGVRLLTIHAAKGLEWDHVFLVGVNEDILPSKRGDPEEERRLFYVAVTRARETLHVSHAGEREVRGGHMQQLKPSRFLEAMGASA